VIPDLAGNNPAMAHSQRRGKRGRLATVVERGARDPKVRAVAASALAVSGAITTGKLVRDRVVERERSRRSRRYRLQAGESPREGVGRVARGQLDLAIELLGHDGDDDEAIHEARKALKRVRAAARLSRDYLGDDRYRHENVILRDAGRQLSGARDARVLLDTFDELAERHADELSAPTRTRLRTALNADAEAAAPTDEASASAVVETLADARVRVATWPLPEDGGPEALAAGFERIYRRGRRALRTADKEASVEHLHELRKRGKDLWHAAQLLRPAAPTRMKKLARRAHRLSDLLGDDHDLAVLLDRVRAQTELLDLDELAALSALVQRRQNRLRREALALGARLYRRKPRKLAAVVAA
jgi:CHAD domain-containing protein